ncbi:MAG: hypothetical protein M3Q45_01315 [Chloroflexota bacterium]|nr:hypothetical protein [Chloroflexota bacterium]
MNDPQRRQLEAYLQRPLPDLEQELSLYAPATRGPSAVWAKIAGPVHGLLCDELRWCEVRQDARFENDYDLSIALFTMLSTRALHLSFDVDLVLISAILAKRGMDAFCGCI